MEDAPPLAWYTSGLGSGLPTGWDGYNDVEMIDMDATDMAAEHDSSEVGSLL